MKTTWFPALALSVTVLLTAGCGVRLSTPVPTAPSPDAVEQVRATTVADSLALASAAESVVTDDPDVEAVLTDVSEHGHEQAHALGGVYRYEPTPTPVPPVVSSHDEVEVDDLVTRLADAAAAAAVAADTVDDPDVAQLVASVAASRADLGRRLAQAAGTDRPASVPASAAAVPAPSSTATAALVLAHDQAAYGLEVIAAQVGGDDRARILAEAQVHRSRAVDLAVEAGIDGTTQDPRRAVYELGDLSDPSGLAVALVTGVEDAAASAVAAAAPGTRGGLVTDLVSAAEEAGAWGATPQALPGVHLLAPSPSPTP